MGYDLEQSYKRCKFEFNFLSDADVLINHLIMKDRVLVTELQRLTVVDCDRKGIADATVFWISKLKLIRIFVNIWRTNGFKDYQCLHFTLQTYFKIQMP